MERICRRFSDRSVLFSGIWLLFLVAEFFSLLFTCFKNVTAMHHPLNTVPRAAAFKMTGGIYTLTTLEFSITTPSLIKAQLEEMSKKAPHFFDHTSVVLAFEKVENPGSGLNLTSIRDILKGFGISVIAVRGNTESVRQTAAAAGLAWLPPPKQHSARKNDNVVMMNQQEARSEINNIPKTEPTGAKALYIDQPVRSGRQIFSPGDLIVTSAVSAGAELLAAGSIHIYGSLRGRALAGTSGDTDARIYCQQFEPELISIAGQYKIPSNKQSPDSLWGSKVMVRLREQSLHITRL